MEIPEVEVYGLADKLWSGELYVLFEHEYVLLCVDVDFVSSTWGVKRESISIGTFCSQFATLSGSCSECGHAQSYLNGIGLISLRLPLITTVNFPKSVDFPLYILMKKKCMGFTVMYMQFE